MTSSFKAKVPEHTLHTLDLYVNHRCRPGGFVQAVLENDLLGAFSRGDDENLAAMKDIVGYIYNDLPGHCWGSKAKVKDWLEGKG